MRNGRSPTRCATSVQCSVRGLIDLVVTSTDKPMLSFDGRGHGQTFSMLWFIVTFIFSFLLFFASRDLSAPRRRIMMPILRTNTKTLICHHQYSWPHLVLAAPLRTRPSSIHMKLSACRDAATAPHLLPVHRTLRGPSWTWPSNVQRSKYSV